MGAGASAETNTRGLNDVQRTWSFLDDHGLHIVEIFHDILSGSKRFFHNGQVAVLTPTDLLGILTLNNTSAHSFSAGQRQLVCRVLEDGLGFDYSLLVDGVDVCEYNRRLRRNCSAWFFELDDRQHWCVALHDHGFAVLLDGWPIETESDFTDHGSRHVFYLGAHRIHIDVLPATAEDVAAAEAETTAAGPLLHPLQPVSGESQSDRSSAALHPLQSVPEAPLFQKPDSSSTSATSASSIASNSFGSESLYSSASSTAGGISSLAKLTKQPKHRYVLTIDDAPVALDRNLKQQELQPRLVLGRKLERLPLVNSTAPSKQ